MIQRIQTLFLILACACMCMFYFLPFGSITLKDTSSIDVVIKGIKYTNDLGETSFYSLLPLLIMIIIITASTFLSIFLYKRRILQVRINVFNLILQLGSIGLMFYFLIDIAKTLNGEYSTSILIVLPIVAAILTFLAIRAIGRDEMLIRSLNRMR